MSAIEIFEISDEADLSEAFAIRHTVFCDEQEVDPSLEFDGLDDNCRQYLARCGATATGTARIRKTGDGEVKIERVAVLAAERNKGIGKALMIRTIEDCRAAGAALEQVDRACEACHSSYR